jgi:hypothetical protein
MTVARVPVVSSRSVAAATCELILRIATALLMTLAAAIVLIHSQLHVGSPSVLAAPERSVVVCAEISC